ncbi:hypothetical protein ACFL42_03045 [Candidatus Omnitrophota bacterium]
MNYSKFTKITKLYFGYEEISKTLNISLGSARVSANRYVKQGILVRIKRNIYVLKSRWDSAGRDEKFILANLLEVPSYISLMTAMEYYGITTQMQRDFVESICIKRTKRAEVENSVFNFCKVEGGLYFGFSREKGFFIAAPEKALLDALYLASLKRYSFDISSVDFRKIDIRVMTGMAKKFPAKTQRMLAKYGYLKKARGLRDRSA